MSVENNNIGGVTVRKSRTFKNVLALADALLSALVIGPLTVCVWRGQWGLMDLHSNYFPGVRSFFIGATTTWILTLLKDPVQKYIVAPPTTPTTKSRKRIFQRLFVYILFTSNILHWRGEWAIIDGALGDNLTWATVSIAISLPVFALCSLKSVRNTVLNPFVIVVDQIDMTFNFPTLFRTKFKKVSQKMYTYVFCFACVLNWSGGWEMIDEYTEDDDYLKLLIGGLCLLGLCLLKSVRNIVASPFVCATDQESIVFTFPTRFRTKSKRETSLYILDCLFSVFIVGSLVVFAWRGAWVIMDLYLYPHDEVLSSIGSLILGYGITVAAFLMQPLMKWLCDRLPDMWRIAVADIFLIFSFIGTVNVWRGIWNCLNIYFLPETPELSCWITHSVCLLLLVLLNCSNSVLVRGVYIDAEEKGGKCVVFPCYYLRIYFQQERVKKNNRKIVQLQTMSKHKQELDFIVTKCDSSICACKNMTEANINHVASNSPLVIQNDGKLNHSEV